MKDNERKFHCWIKYDSNNKIYVAGCFEIKTLYSQGETKQEAEKAIKDAIKLFFKHAPNEAKECVIAEMNKTDYYNPMIEIE